MSLGPSLSLEEDPGPDHEGPGEGARYYPVSILKFVVMSVPTAGLYHVYWFYKSWCYVRERDQSDIWPFVRAFFAPLTYPLLLRDLNDEEAQRQDEELRLAGAPSVFGPWIGYLVTNSLWRLPGLLGWLALLSFVPLLPALRRINALNGPDSAAFASHSRWGVRHVLLLILAAPLLGLLIAGDAGLLPSDEMQPGSALSSTDRAFLQEAILKHGEDVLYFQAEYSFSRWDAGSLLTDQRVVAFRREPDTGKVHVQSATFSSIRSVTIEVGSALDVTSVRVDKRSGAALVLRLSTSEGGDRLFVDELDRRLPFGTPVRVR